MHVLIHVLRRFSQLVYLPSCYFLFQADKRAHHNALERKRRDHIKDSFAHLRDSIPSLQGEKVRFKEVDLFTVWRKIRCNQPKCKT